MKDLITIAEFAKMCRTTVRTIRFYDQLDLIKPVKIDQWTKYRYYSPLQTRDFFRIRLMQNFKVPLAQIQSKTTKTNNFLENRIKKAHEEYLEKKKEYEFLKKIKSFLFADINLTKAIVKETVGPFILFATTIKKSSYHQINSEIVKVHEMAKKLKINYSQDMVFYLDPSKYKPKDIDIEVALICKYKKIPKNIKLPEGFYFREFSKTTVYAFTYQGPFEFITLVYEKLYESKILKLPYISSYPFDYYTFGPWDKESSSPYDYTTKICFPKKPEFITQIVDDRHFFT